MNNPARWWEQLPHDYYQRVDATEIDADHRFKVHGSALADRVLRTGLGSLVSAAMAPGLVRRSGVARERAALRWYQPLADRAALEDAARSVPSGRSSRSTLVITA